MSKDVVQFDMTALRTRVSDNVRAQFGMLIPDDEFKKLVEREIKTFFDDNSTEWVFEEKEVKASDGWRPHSYLNSTKAKLTPFRMLVWQECHKACEAKLLEVLSGPLLKNIVQQTWDPNGRQGSEIIIGELIGKQIERMIPQIVAQMFSHHIMDITNQVKQSVLQSLPSRPF